MLTKWRTRPGQRPRNVVNICIVYIAKAYVIDLCQRTLWSADIQIDEHRLLFGKGTSIIHI